MKNLKKILDSIAGVGKHRISVRIRQGLSDNFQLISFVVEIESAYLTEILKVALRISDRTINDIHDEDEFDYEFHKKTFQEEFKYDFHENFNLDLLGIDVEDVEFEYKFV